MGGVKFEKFWIIWKYDWEQCHVNSNRYCPTKQSAVERPYDFIRYAFQLFITHVIFYAWMNKMLNVVIFPMYSIRIWYVRMFLIVQIDPFLFIVITIGFTSVLLSIDEFFYIIKKYCFPNFFYSNRDKSNENKWHQYYRWYWQLWNEYLILKMKILFVILLEEIKQWR